MANKSCPFCGSANLEEESTAASEYYGYMTQSCWIECNDCGAYGPTCNIGDHPDCDSTEYQFVRDKWNTRAPVKVTDEMVLRAWKALPGKVRWSVMDAAMRAALEAALNGGTE